MTITDCDQPDLIGKSWTTNAEGVHSVDGGERRERPARVRRIYVASSWRNLMQPAFVAALRSAGHEVYDFKNPRDDDHGFHWTDVGMKSYDRATNSDVPIEEYLTGIAHPIAVAGFTSDFDAMKWADTCVLVLPCGRSAHLEAGWFAGASGRELIIVTGNDDVTPELMYRMADAILPTMNDLLGYLGTQPELGFDGWVRGRDA